MLDRTKDIAISAQAWLDEFERSLGNPDAVALDCLFLADCFWGFGDGFELRNMYARTNQPGLWFIAGSLAQCRINSKYLALQIKAIEKGMLPPAAAASMSTA